MNTLAPMAQFELFLCIVMRVAFPFDSLPGRRIRGWGAIGPSLPANSTAPPPAPAMRQLAGNGVPLGVNRGDARPDGRLVRPVIGIETMDAFGQSVPIVRRGGSTDNPLLQLTVASAEAGRLLGADRPSQQRFVFDHGRRRLGRRPGTRRLRPAAVTRARRSRRATANLDARQSRLA
jgi:hypothetical protein